MMGVLGITSLELMGCGSPPAAERPSGGAREQLSAEQCETRGAHVVGDIGDGATQRQDYVCPGGSAPIANIVAPAGGPIGVEGSVCCPK